MAIENSVSNDFRSTFVDCINVFKCRLAGVVLDSCTCAFTNNFSTRISFICVSFLATQKRIGGERMNAFENGTTVTSSCMDTGIATGSEYHVMILSGRITNYNY